MVLNNGGEIKVTVGSLRMKELANLVDGAKVILVDICHKLNNSGLTYAIVGGW